MIQNELSIENRTGKKVEPFVHQILSRMFAGYARVTIRSEFTSGLSSGRVFLVRPIPQEGAELPVVIKIDYADRITREHEAFRRFTRNRLPRMAEIRGEPVFTPDAPFGGLCYPFVGSGEFTIRSLQAYLQEASLEEIQKLLEKQLFPALETLWRQAQKGYPDFCLEDYYDSFLPMNLIIEAAPVPESITPIILEPDTARPQLAQNGDFVQVIGFQIVKVNRQGHKLSLDIPPSSHRFSAYRLQMTNISDIEAYHVGQILSTPLTGIVRASRTTLLQQQAQKVLGTTWDLAAATLPLSPQLHLPNPLTALPGLLNNVMDVFLGTIHGDLNLQNILVETDSQTPYLIDFAQSRQDHLLRDLLHLEMAIITKIIPEQLTQAGLSAAEIVPFYQRLHCAWQQAEPIPPHPHLEKMFAVLLLIRQATRPLLHKSHKWQEYYYGLYVYLLGALRYDDLDAPPLAPLPKQLAFWGAAAILQLLQKQPDCGRLFSPPTPATSTPATTEHNTIIHNVTGQVHTGSGNINIQIATPSTSPEPALQYRPSSRVAFLNILKQYFNLGELQELCLELGIDYENLAGTSKSDKARELLLHCERHGLSNRLVQLSHLQRPNAPWNTIQ
ncbi:MAG: phosphotransferase [Chloroflexi bacterium]|nr:phosphotransferase [Chloroflexota bacterium]MBP8059266.1 phosphotransferase [Chloroflexota bacterium]